VKLMPACRDVARAVSGDELAELPLGRRLLMRWHLFVCRDCLRYAQQLQAIGRVARDLDLSRETDPGIESERLASLEANILAGLERGAGGPDRMSDSADE
jgi:hypothetical protein